MGDNDLRKQLGNLSYGDVIKYQHTLKDGPTIETYLVVEKVENGKISGQMASANAVNGISIDYLLEIAEKLEIADFKKVK